MYIGILFVKVEGLARCLIAHTCSSLLELPKQCENFQKNVQNRIHINFCKTLGNGYHKDCFLCSWISPILKLILNIKACKNALPECKLHVYVLGTFNILQNLVKQDHEYHYVFFKSCLCYFIIHSLML